MIWRILSPGELDMEEFTKYGQRLQNTERGLIQIIKKIRGVAAEKVQREEGPDGPE